MSEWFGIAAAFAAGFISVFSPCVLPMMPIYLCYLSGVKVEDLGTERERHRRVILNAVAFMLGYTVIFTIMGGLVGLMGGLAGTIKAWLPRLGGLLIMFFGFYMMHIIEIPFFDRQRELRLHFQKVNLATSFILGMTFSVSWIPCITPMLSSILMLAASTGSSGSAVAMLASYALGMSIPFLFIALFARGMFRFIEQHQTYLKYYNYVAGGLLIVIGLLVLLGRFANILGRLGIG